MIGSNNINYYINGFEFGRYEIRRKIFVIGPEWLCAEKTMKSNIGYYIDCFI